MTNLKPTTMFNSILRIFVIKFNNFRNVRGWIRSRQTFAYAVLCLKDRNADLQNQDTPFQSAVYAATPKSRVTIVDLMAGSHYQPSKLTNNIHKILASHMTIN